MGKMGILNNLEEVAEPLPIEVNKIIMFFKLFIINPFIMFSMTIMVATAIYFGESGTETAMISLVASIFIFVAFVVSRVFISVNEVKIEHEVQKWHDTKELTSDVISNREFLRRQWIEGWRIIYIEQMSLFHEEIEKLLAETEMEVEQRLDYIARLHEAYMKVKGKYKELFSTIHSSDTEFVMNMIPPPETGLHYLKELDDVLNMVQNIKIHDELNIPAEDEEIPSED